MKEQILIKGIPLTPKNFGKANPSQDTLTKYALSQENVESLDKLSKGLFIINDFNKDKWLLTKREIGYKWVNIGKEDLNIASTEHLGIVKGSSEPLEVAIKYDGSMYINNLKEDILDISNALLLLNKDKITLKSLISSNIKHEDKTLDNHLNYLYTNLDYKNKYPLVKDTIKLSNWVNNVCYVDYSLNEVELNCPIWYAINRNNSNESLKTLKSCNLYFIPKSETKGLFICNGKTIPKEINVDIIGWRKFNE